MYTSDAFTLDSITFLILIMRWKVIERNMYQLLFLAQWPVLAVGIFCICKRNLPLLRIVKGSI